MSIENDAKKYIQDAMSNVIQEMIVVLDGQHHMVYITLLEYTDEGLICDFSVLDSGMKEALIPHVKACLNAQISEQINIEVLSKPDLNYCP